MRNFIIKANLNVKIKLFTNLNPALIRIFFLDLALFFKANLNIEIKVFFILNLKS